MITTEMPAAKEKRESSLRSSRMGAFFGFVEPRVILTAEDDANDRFFINRAFRDCCTGHRVIFVNDGEEAIAYLQGNSPFNDRQKHPLPAMLLVDVKMPRMNGFEVLEWVRRQSDWHRLPVVMLSSSALDKDIQRAYDLNANTYLTKPATFTQLAKSIEDLCHYWFFISQLPHCGPDLHAAQGDYATAP